MKSLKAKFILFFIFFKSIKFYGLLNTILIFSYEAFYLVKYQRSFDLTYDEKSNTSYKETKNRDKKYDVPYLPTPYFFLSKLKKFFNRKKISHFIFFDFGCGYSRPGFYLSIFFKLKIIGIEINDKILKFLNKNKQNYENFYKANLRNEKKIRNLVQFHSKKNTRNIYFVSDTVEYSMIKKIINKILKKKTDFFVMVNTNYSLILNDKLKLVYKFECKDKSRNIAIVSKK